MVRIIRTCANRVAGSSSPTISICANSCHWTPLQWNTASGNQRPWKQWGKANAPNNQSVGRRQSIHSPAPSSTPVIDFDRDGFIFYTRYTSRTRIMESYPDPESRVNPDMMTTFEPAGRCSFCASFARESCTIFSGVPYPSITNGDTPHERSS